MESFTIIINGFSPLTIATKLSILDFCGGPAYVSVLTTSKSSIDRLS